ncbi:hypothetical protein [Yoonia sp.]|uniref:hypothetical protein n=1 Tax=Yoonia sp. TaxID=2212373 RepID=UPI003918A9C9
MTTQPAYDVITLSHGGNTVRLHPSLRAATYLERLHDGFENLFSKVDQFDTATIKAIILIAATDRAAAEALMTAAEVKPLRVFVEITHGKAVALCTSLVTNSADHKEVPEGPQKPIPWASFYQQLFQIATGWLGWTPDAAWNATPSEITSAFAGHLQKLKAIHGAHDDQNNDTTTMTAEQRAANEEAGLDPDFDREGLRALKARHGGRT